ncbi:MAG TPA: PAS domain S-box protein [Anaeromyxobacteraceae bacterium]|nr:PAS domain S-box protein [Anaeromyxobacteraceae bacterium]
MSPELAPPRFASRTLRAVAVAILVIDLVVVGAAWRSIVESRREAYASAERTTQNLARVLAENLEGTIRLIDLALTGVADEIADARAHGDHTAPSVAAILARFHGELPFLDALRTASRDGRVEPGPGVPSNVAIDIADRDYFLAARERRGTDLVVSAPLVSRITGKRSLTVGRRLELPGGDFDGIVYAVLTLDQFTQTLASVDIGRDVVVALRDRDLTLVARFPERDAASSAMGKRQVTGNLKEAIAAGRKAATFVGLSPVDRVERVTSFRSVAGGTFYLLVAAASEEFLSAWRAQVIRTAAAAGLFVLLTALAAWYVARSLRRESEASFRALVEGAPIAVTLTRGTRVAYVNPAFVKEFGLPGAAVAIGRSLLDSVLPADVARTQERIERRLRGEPVEPTAEITLLRPDGTSFLASVTDAMVALTDGPTVVGFIQDITERKQSEVERERLIGELKAALADVKTLRGLLPICAHCKKIRDDRGYWNRIETFIRERSDAQFTHGICPDCAKRFFPDDGDDEPKE